MDDSFDPFSAINAPPATGPRSHRLRADQDAVVLTVSKVSVGSVMQSGEPLITLVRHA